MFQYRKTERFRALKHTYVFSNSLGYIIGKFGTLCYKYGENQSNYEQKIG